MDEQAPGGGDRKIRVLIVDDSLFVRFTLRTILSGEPDIEIVGEAIDGESAIAEARRVQPDVVTLDIHMKGMDGLTALPQIITASAARVVMLSAFTEKGAPATIQALELGAVDFIPKPGGAGVRGGPPTPVGAGSGLRAIAPTVVQKVRAAGLARGVGAPSAPVSRPARPRYGARGGDDRRPSVLIIGASTGGPRALIEVIPHLPPDCRDAIIVVQHMPAEFTPSFARRLNDLSFLPVKEAQEGDSIHAGRVLVAPGDFHLEIGPDRRVHLSRGPHRHGVRPAVDVTLETAVPVFRDRVTAVVLTGMGADGAEGCAKVVAAGGTVVAQDRDSSNIWGMPRAVAERNPSAIVVPLSAVPETLVRLARERSRETV